MTELTKLEVGKTYVFKSEDAKEAYLDKCTYNEEAYKAHYDDGFTVARLDSFGDGYSSGTDGVELIAIESEGRFFKLKEEDNETIEDKDNMQTFTKKDLKTGHVVKTRDNLLWLVMLGCTGQGADRSEDAILCKGGWDRLDEYEDDLTSGNEFAQDIVEVFKTESYCYLLEQWDNENKLISIWKRETKSPEQLQLEELEEKISTLQEQANSLKEKISNK